MRNRKLKRIGSGVLAAAIAMSTYVGTALPAMAAAVGNDGSAEMNEAYAAHESLMPIGPSFNVDTLLEWTPESDPDARYSKASVALENRTGGFVVNPKANPEAKLMLCSLANSAHDTTSAQGTEDFMSWSFNYWQYVDSFVYWSGSEEGLICCPTGEFTDAAHKNGVPVVATLGFPWGTGAGYVEEVSDFCQKAEDGSFPVADKLLEVMEYYGFDGYFFNQESYGCTAEIAARMNEMIKYMRQKCPDILISWYDSMLPSGSVYYQNAVNTSNQAWMEPDESGNYCVDEFFMNYNWYEGQVSTTISTMNSIGRSPFQAFAGLDVQQNCMNTEFRDHVLLDENGKMKLSLALYCSNSTLGISSSGENFHQNERTFYVNSASDPRVETSDPTSSTNEEWVGMSRFFADKTPITSAPFVTNFNSGHGRGYWVDGVLSRDAEWSYQSNQDVMPTWTWIIDSEGSKLSGEYDFTDAYNGGNSIKFEGALDANKPNDIMLYSTDITVTDGMQMSLTYKNDDGKMQLVGYYGDDETTSYEDCTKVYYNLTAGEADTWTTTSVDISAQAGKKLYAIGMQIESDTAVSDYQVNLGQLTITEQERAALSATTSITLDDILYHDAYDAEIRLYWDEVEGASSYEVYKVNSDGTSNLLMATPNTALYLPTVIREADEQDVTLKVVAINENGVRGEAKTIALNWLYSNDDSEKYEAVEFENVCLNAEVTYVSNENSGEPAVKAIDGTSANGSKWCATNIYQGYMDIDIGREVTVKRWRVEHAEYGGESNDMNTLDFALEYKDAGGNWVQAKRIQNNHLAVTDVLLDTPITAQEWRLRIYDDGSSQWGGIRIYEWQMFESDQFPQTEAVMMHFATAQNNPGATDTFTLTHVPVGQTVKVYTKSGDTYTEIASAVAEDSTVTFTDLDFGTAEAGRIYYTTTAVGSEESVKQSAPFEAENIEKSAPATDVSFVKYSQVGSTTSSNGDDIFTTMTVNGLSEGDVVYVYEADSETWTKMSQPVAEGETSVTIDGVKVVRAGGKLTLQVKRVGQLISDKYTVDTPEFAEPTAQLELKAFTKAGLSLTGVVYGVYNASGDRVAEVSTETPATVTLGTYTLKCESVPEGYRVSSETALKIVRTEGQTYTVSVTISSDSDVPTVTDISVTPLRATVKKGETQQFTAVVTGENDPSQEVTWKVENAVSATTTISDTGLLTVGKDETAETLTVTATSTVDPTKSASATVTVANAESETENVALGANVIAYNGDNLGADQGPEKLFDGDVENPDTGKWCVNGNNMWVAFDIGEERELTELKMVHAGAAGETPAGKINTANYEFYMLDESKISVEDLLAKSYEERCTLLADNSYWKLITSTTDNANDITTNDLTGNSGRIFKINISRTDTTGWAACVRVYELELYSPIPQTSVLLSQDADILGVKTDGATANEKAMYAFDGDYSTKWCDATPNWVVFDIGEKAVPDRLKVVHANGADVPEGAQFNTVAFALQVLDPDKISESEFLSKTSAERQTIMDDDSYWKTIKSYDNNALDVTDDPIETTDAARLYRFVVTDGDSHPTWKDTLRVYEIELYGMTVSEEPGDKTQLNALIAEVEALDESDYTVATWAALEEKLEAAKAVADDATQDVIDAAYDALLEAKGALVERGDKTALDALIAEVEALDESDYTVATWAALEEKLEAAKAVADDATQDVIDAAYDALFEAKNALVERGDKAELNALIAEVEALNQDEYTSTTWAVLGEKLEAAKAVADDATQDVIDAAYDALLEAKGALVKRGDKTELADEVERVDIDPSTLPEDFPLTTAFMDALNKAKEVLANVDATQDEVDAAYEALVAAEDCQANAAILYTMLTIVDEAIAEGEDQEMTAASWAEVMNVYNAAKALLENVDEATAEELDSQITALTAAVEALVPAGDQSAAKGLLETAKQEDLSKYTEESAQAILAAIEKMEAVIAERGSQEEIDAAYAALEKALSEAELLPTEPTTPEEPETSPDTGDSTPFMMPIVFMALAGAFLFFKKRRDAR